MTLQTLQLVASFLRTLGSIDASHALADRLEAEANRVPVELQRRAQMEQEIKAEVHRRLSDPMFETITAPSPAAAP